MYTRNTERQKRKKKENKGHWNNTPKYTGQTTPEHDGEATTDDRNSYFVFRQETEMAQALMRPPLRCARKTTKVRSQRQTMHTNTMQNATTLHGQASPWIPCPIADTTAITTTKRAREKIDSPELRLLGRMGSRTSAEIPSTSNRTDQAALGLCRGENSTYRPITHTLSRCDRSKERKNKPDTKGESSAPMSFSRNSVAETLFREVTK